MALEIVHLDDAFEFKGTFNESDLEKFRLQFKDIFNQTDRLVINIDCLKGVDRYGVMAFEELYKQSLKSQKQFFITGFGCRDMYDHLKTMKVA